MMNTVSGLSLNSTGGINNLVAFLSSINPINQSQLTIDLSHSPAPLTPAPQPVLFSYTVKIQNSGSNAGPVKFIVHEVHDFQVDLRA